MQAKLPDINAAWVKERTYFFTCRDMHNWSGMILALYAMNALLPDEYRIKINTQEYNDLVEAKIGYICGTCKAEIPESMVKVKTAIAPLLVSYISSSETKNYWVCHKCNAENLMSRTKLIKETLAKPSYLKVVTDPPERKRGIQDRRSYQTEMTKWSGIFFQELEHQLGLYRAEYINEMDSMEGEMSGI